MSNDPYARPSIDRQWIKANVLGAAASALAGLFGFGLNQLFGVNMEGAEAGGFVIYAALLVLANSLALALYGFLLGVVLRQKLSAFPMRSWVAIYVGFGIMFSALTVYASMRPESAEPPDPALFEVTAGTLIGALIGGSIIGALSGVTQAWILRSAAHGLGAWIKFSAIAGGLLFVLVVATTSVAPAGSFASELVSETTMFVGSVLAAYIMLPAVWRLQPR
jgi:hypothetical protein